MVKKLKTRKEKKKKRRPLWECKNPLNPKRIKRKKKSSPKIKEKEKK